MKKHFIRGDHSLSPPCAASIRLSAVVNVLMHVCRRPSTEHSRFPRRCTTACAQRVAAGRSEGVNEGWHVELGREGAR